jgi:phospholipid/cholesterol/gamma-HCH transport system substrate-binding protein
MVVEVNPGTAKGHIEGGDRIPLARTEPNVQLDQFLNTLDADTRQYLQLLLAGGAEGIGGHARQLSGAFRRLKPFAHTVAQLNRAVAQRHVALARVIHDFGLLTNELSRHDAEIKRFVSSSDAALGNFAHQQQSIQLALREFPSTLRAVQAGLGASNRFSTVAGPALLKLIPQAQALQPAFRATKHFFAETTGPIRDQIRPFTREVRPVLTQTARSAKPLEQTVRSFGNALGGFNSFLNELAFKPKGSRQSYLFYLPWLNHDLNSTFSLQDAGGPLGRGIVMLACNGAQLAEGLGAAEPILGTVLEVTRAPRRTELPEIGNAKSFIRCGPNVATTPTTTTTTTK